MPKYNRYMRPLRLFCTGSNYIWGTWYPLATVNFIVSWICLFYIYRYIHLFFRFGVKVYIKGIILYSVFIVVKAKKLNRLFVKFFISVYTWEPWKRNIWLAGKLYPNKTLPSVHLLYSNALITKDSSRLDSYTTHVTGMQGLLADKITPNTYVFNSLMNVNAHSLNYNLSVYKHMQVMHLLPYCCCS